MFRRRPATTSNALASAVLPVQAQAVAARLARLAADGHPVAPATFAKDAHRGYICVYAERAGGVRMVAHIATPEGRREWRADVDVDGTLRAWQPSIPPVTRVADLDVALEFAPA